MSWPKPFFVKEKPKTKIKGYDCESCGLYKGCKSPKMEPTGEGRLGVLCVAEAPGGEEDLQNIQLIGDAGQLFRKKLAVHGLDLDRDFYKHNSLACRTPNNREPKLSELKCCRPRLFKAIEELKPKMIWLMGNHALESYFMDRRLDNKKIGLWRKRCIPDPLTNAYIIPMLHPSFMLRNQGNRNIESVYDRDLKWAISQTNRESPHFPEYESKLKLITDYDQLVHLLDMFIKNEPTIFVFDYETTGIKPHKPGNKIASISFCSGEEAYSFPYQYPGIWNEKQLATIKQKWINVLISPVLKKVAHNLKFEDAWSRHIFGVQPTPWNNCSMVTQHVLDDRTGCCGLKFQAFVRWGIYGYDDIIDPYKKETANGLNRMLEAPLMELLKYNAMDALLEYWLYQEQQKELSLSSNKSLRDATDFFHEGLLTFADMEQDGIPVNMDYYKKEEKRLETKIKQLENKLDNSSVALEFESKEGRKVNWGSNTDLPKLLFTYCKIKSRKKTASGKHESVDADALEMYAEEHPFINDLITKRKLEKTKGTYLAQFIREEYNGKIYPIFNLHTARSFRSCVAKGTFVDIIRDKTPVRIPIEQVRKGNYAYCFDDNLKPAIRIITWAGKTGTKGVVRIHWKGGPTNKGFLDVTPDHLVRLVDGTYTQAKNLRNDHRTEFQSKQSPKTRVLAFHRDISKIDRLFFTNNAVLEHRFLYSQLIGPLKDEEIVHHKDENHYNNHLDNLSKMKNLPKHSSYHYPNTIGTKKSREKNRMVVINNWKKGAYDHIIKRGKDNSNWLGLSRWKCLRILAESKGQLTVATKRKKQCDFGTLKKYLKLYKIDSWLVRLRYDSNGNYISKNRLIKVAMNGIEASRKEFGHNYYKLKKLYQFYSIPFNRKWGNQFGPFTLYNHIITNIEWINKKVDVYDIEVEETHNFFANEICVHNSSSDPNFQNIPVRDEEAKRSIRSGIIPSPGNKILEIDFGGIEVAVAAATTKDPVLMNYLIKGGDMHRDQAFELFFLDETAGNWKEPPLSDIRFYTKNQWTFPQFYGSYFVSCAKNLWGTIEKLKLENGKPLKQHLKENRIITYQGFESHLERKEKKFWDRFKVFREWQEQIINFYQGRGYIQMFHGFRRSGLLDRNQIINSTIQGSAFHILLAACIKINKIRKEENWKTTMPGQIHDSIFFDLNPSEEKHVLKTVSRIMTKDIPKMYKWVNVPLKVEAEITEVDGSWYTKKPTENNL